MATIPSIAMIPSGYKADKLYSVLPTTGIGDFTFARTSVATRVNKSGLIEEVLTGIPRLDYSDGACPSLLLEPQRLQKIQYSEEFSGASWFKSGNAFVSDNFAISPDGNLNGSKFTFDGTTNATVNTTISVTNGVSYTFSVWLKNDNLSDPTKVWVGLSTTTQGEYVTVTNVWKRFIITSTSNGTLEYPRVQTSEVGSVFAWGAQLEQGSYPTSYIKNEGTVAGITRAADTATGSGDATVINSTEGTLYFEGNSFSSTGSSGLISLNVGTTDLNNRVTIELDGANVKARFAIGGTSLGIFNYATDITQVLKIAVKYKANDFALWVNGTERVPLTSGNSFSANTLSELDFNRGDGQEPFIGNTKDLRVYNTALSDLEIETLSSWTSFTAMANALKYTII